MTEKGDTNGSSTRMLQWLVGILIGLMLSMGAFGLRLHGLVSEHRTWDTSFEKRLDRIEAKLDQLILRSHETQVQ